MNKLLLALTGVLLLLTPCLQAKEELWSTDYAAALQLAKEQNKPLVMDFTGSDWCGWCIKLDKEVFSQPEFIKYAKENLVLLEVDFPNGKKLSSKVKKQNDKLAEEYQIQGYPTIVVLGADGKKLGTLGYQEGGPKNWIAALEKITKKS